MVGVGGFECGEGIGRAAIGEGTACVEVGQQHQFVGVEDFGGFSHEMYPGEDNHIGFGGGGLLGQPQGIAKVVGDVLDVGVLVVVSQDDRIHFLLEILNGGKQIKR